MLPSVSLLCFTMQHFPHEDNEAKCGPYLAGKQKITKTNPKPLLDSLLRYHSLDMGGV